MSRGRVQRHHHRPGLSCGTTSRATLPSSLSGTARITTSASGQRLLLRRRFKPARRQVGHAPLAALDVAQRVGRIVLQMVGDAAAHFAARANQRDRRHGSSNGSGSVVSRPSSSSQHRADADSPPGPRGIVGGKHQVQRPQVILGAGLGEASVAAARRGDFALQATPATWTSA